MGALLSLFANPAFLPGLLAAGLPVLIHLLAKHRAKQIYFPTIRFLMQTSEQTSRRRKLEDLILLLLRAGAVAALAFALARPVVSSGLSMLGQSDLAVAIVLDNTLSTNQKCGGENAHSKIREALANTIKSIPDGAKWGIWQTCAQNPEGKLRQLATRTLSEKDIAEIVGKTTPTHAACNMQRIFADVNKHMSAAPSSAREIYILSDGQETEWKDFSTEAATTNNQDNSDVFFFSPDGCGGGNLNISNITLKARAPLVGETLRIEVTIHNSSARDTHTTVSLYMADACIAKRGLTATASSDSRVFLELPLAKAGKTEGFVRIDTDNCEADNRRFFALDVRDRINVLVIEESTSKITRNRPAYYINAALAPTSTCPVHVRTIRPSELPRENIDKYDAICLVEVSSLKAEGTGMLKGYTATGGTLIMMPGDRVDAKVWDDQWGQASDSRGGILPARLGEIHSYPQDKALCLRPGDSRHPIIAPFAAMAGESFRKTKILRAFELISDKKTQKAAAIFLENGSPFLVTKRYGKGRVALWAAPPRPDWMTLQARPVFVPIMHLITYRGMAISESDTLECGNPLRVKLEKDIAQPQLDISTPNGRKATFTAYEIGQENTWAFTDTWTDGIYHTELKGVPGVKSYAINPSSAEGDLSVIDRNTIADTLKPFGQTYIAGNLAELDDLRKKSRQGLEFMNPLLIASVILLVLEAIASSRRARHAGA